MNWFQKTSQDISHIENKDNYKNYPIAGSMVSGLKVSDQVNNLSSIGASLSQYEILPKIREIPMSDFGDSSPHSNFYARDDIGRCQKLANEIKQSGEITPLIVVLDDEGPYILEGGHRFVALGLIDIHSFPALVVIDGGLTRSASTV